MKHIDTKRDFPFRWYMVLLCMMAALHPQCGFREPGLDLERGFKDPPRIAQPHVMWWWLNSHVSKAGITRDLEEMRKQGIGGALIFDASPVDRWQRHHVNPVPAGPAFLSPEWRECFRHAIREARRLDIELGVSMTSGFNAGGPWVTPEYAQQELVWSELKAEGGKSISRDLPLPSGPVYGDDGMPLKYNEMTIDNALDLDKNGRPVHYRDVAVLALKLGSGMQIHPGRSLPSDVLRRRVRDWPLKSVHSFHYPEDNGFLFEKNYMMLPDRPGDAVVHREAIMDVSDRLSREGRLTWDVPEGEWVILRFGHTHTGIMLQATNPQNRGLAMNHLSREAASRHFEEIADKLVEDNEEAGGGLRYLYLDSWEVRIANWTDGFETEFLSKRGYDMTRYLPALAGYIVDSREITNRFLHDYRMTIGDCIADNYYGTFRELSNDRGLEFRSEMATTPIPVDMLKCLGRCDLPVGEFWAESGTGAGRDEPWERMFGKQAASAAHIYGLPVAAAEALTVIDNHWEYGPYQLKRTVDQALCSGLNRLEIHTLTHSPPDVPPPGYEYFAGTHFNPQITWWEQAGAFTGYISRCQFLLQQGRFVADVCIYQGDRIPNFVVHKQTDPRLGPGYDYDVINTEALLSRMTVRDGRLCLPDGMRYRLLLMPPEVTIDPEVLEKISGLVRAGATVVGPKPERAYGLSDYPECDARIKQLADSLWDDVSRDQETERSFGKGRIIRGRSARDVLIEDGVSPDFEWVSRVQDSELGWIHRRVDGRQPADIYFVANMKERWEEVECRFRISGRIPELWNAESGVIGRAGVYREAEDRITVDLRLSPLGSCFVVFRQSGTGTNVKTVHRDRSPAGPPADIPDVEMSAGKDDALIVQAWQPGTYGFEDNLGHEHTIAFEDILLPIPVEGPWSVHFQRGRGAPDSVCFDRLIPWNQADESGVRYFAGTAAYRTTFEMESSLDTSVGCMLDLGEVREIAEVRLNGKNCGILWKPPFRLDITSHVQPGVNHLSVHVTNLWPNRLIGDQSLDPEERIAFTNIQKFTARSRLIDSGLLGPVKVRFSKKIVLPL